MENILHEQARFWRDAALHDLELLRATYITHSFSPHIHEGFAIGVIEQGAERFLYRRETHVAPSGSIVLINPGEVHTGSAATAYGWSYRMLYPHIDLLQNAASEVVGRSRGLPFFASPIVHDPSLAAQLLRFHATLEEGTSVLERESQLLWIFAQLIIRYADDHPVMRASTHEPALVQKVRSYLEEHASENIALEDLAQLANMSPFHLLRVFRNTVGLPPHAYLTQIRVRRARELLIAGTPIVDVALQTGFVDQSHLTRHFKRIVGVPPGHYLLAAHHR